MEQETETFDQELKRIRGIIHRNETEEASADDEWVEMDEIGVQEKDETLEHLREKLPENLSLAAERIRSADILLLTTGAGFSADSGLAVYVDVAKVSVRVRNRGSSLLVRVDIVKVNPLKP